MYIFFKVCLEYPQNIEEIKRSNDKKHINLTNEKNSHSYEQKKLVLFTSTSSFKEYVKTTWSKKCHEWQNLIACVQ